MTYFVSRNSQEYGPYSLEDLRRYAASGQILLTDMARSAESQEFLQVSQILSANPAAPVGMAQPFAYSDPPNLHWVVLLIISIFTFGFFGLVWVFVQAIWMRSVAPQSRAIVYYTGAVAIYALYFVFSVDLAVHHERSGYPLLLSLIALIFIYAGRFSLRNSLERHFNSVEHIGLVLGGVMTFFFGEIYFQYHINRIIRLKNVLRIGAVSV